MAAHETKTYVARKLSLLGSVWEIYDGEHVAGRLKVLRKSTYSLAEGIMSGKRVRIGFKGWHAGMIYMKDEDGTVIGESAPSSGNAFRLRETAYEWKGSFPFGGFAWTHRGKEAVRFGMRWSKTCAVATTTSEVMANDGGLLVLAGFYKIRVLKLRLVLSLAAIVFLLVLVV